MAIHMFKMPTYFHFINDVYDRERVSILKLEVFDLQLYENQNVDILTFLSLQLLESLPPEDIMVIYG